MKKLLLLLALLPAFVIAAPAEKPNEMVRLTFDRVSLVQLIKVVYGDVLQENFVVSPDLVNSDQAVTVEFQDHMDRKQVRQFMGSFLNGLGIAAEQKSGYVLVHPIADEEKQDLDQEVFFYRPKYRAVSYITDLSSSLFKHGKFTQQRGVKGAQVRSPSGGTGPSAQNKPVDTGDTAFSAMDKTDADAFIFTGPAREIALLQKLLPQIDVPGGEVMVKGVVYEVTTTDNEGSAFSLAASILGQRFGVNVGQTLTGGDSVSITTPNFTAVLGALNNDTHFKSINNASLRVKSGSTGVLSVGSDVPVLGGVTVTAGGASQQSVSYQQSGVIFTLSPTVRDDSIDLTIDQQISSFAQTTTGVNGSPTLTKREMSTVVAAKQDDVIVIGGLDQDQSTKGSAGASFLPAFFHSDTGNSTKTQVLLVLNVHKI